MISWEYLAGMIDADGCIGTTRTGKYKNVVVRVTIANTNHLFLQQLKETFGGSLSLRSRGAKENWKPFGSISWTNRQAEVILENVLPFLIIKKEQAIFALELIHMRNLPKSERYTYIKRDSRGATPVLKSNIKEKEELIAFSIKELNRRGV